MRDINNTPVYWFIFYNDQLLLQKKGETYTIPCCVNAPVQAGNILEVASLEDISCRTVIADYAGGTICLQEEELSEGAFYTKENLPELPRKLSLARKMIDWWLEQSDE